MVERETGGSLGNVDYHDWLCRNLANFLTDADLVLDAFHSSCFKVGPGSVCSLVV